MGPKFDVFHAIFEPSTFYTSLSQGKIKIWMLETQGRKGLYMIMKVWNQTYALTFSTKMLTDQIMDQIEIKTGVPTKQQRITHKSRRFPTRRALKYYNIHENDTIDLSRELQDGTGTTDPTRQPTMDTEELTYPPHTTTLRPPSESLSNDEQQKQESMHPTHQTWTPLWSKTYKRHGKAGEANPKSGHAPCLR